jgi:hypothetical protein
VKEQLFYTILIAAWFVVGVVTFVSLLFIAAPYGRHSRPGWGRSIQARFGWLVMEAVSPASLCAFIFLGNGITSPAVLVFTALWVGHYVNRAFIYPFRMRGGKRPMALSVMFMAVFFNVVNGYINGRHLGVPRWVSAGKYGPEWLVDPRFVAGAVLFVSGFAINFHSDHVLRKLRGGEEHGYRVPREGVFTLVTGANYLGEIVEWFGWACMTWSLPGLAFAFWTACNLVPRARSHHRWYLEKFPDYPKRRRVIFPFVY